MANQEGQKTAKMPAWVAAVVLVACMAAGPAPAPAAKSEAAADAFTPTLISLQVTDGSADDVLEVLRKQSGREIWFSGGASPRGKVTVDFDKKPFWPALFEVCRQLKVSPSMNNRSISLNFGGTAAEYPRSSSGGCLFQLSRIEHSAFADLTGGGVERHTMAAQLQLYFDPKLPVNNCNYLVTVEEALDEHGRSMAPAQKPSDGNTNSSSLVATLTATLNYPPGAGSTRIAKLKGYATLFTKGKTETWEIDNVMDGKPEPKRIDGIDFAFQSVSASGPAGSFAVAITVYADRQDRLMSQRLNNFMETTRLVDDAGNDMGRQGGGIVGGGTAEAVPYKITFQSPGGHKPAKLIVSIPTDIREVHVPFEFADLPLP